MRDYRKGQIDRLTNVQTFLDNRLTADDVLGLRHASVLIATGAQWRVDGVGRYHTRPICVAADAEVLSPTEIMSGQMPNGRRVVVWDDDHYYMGGVLAELLADRGYETVYMTPAPEASTWTRATMEQHFIQARLLNKGVRIQVSRAIHSVARGQVQSACVFTGNLESIGADAVVLVTARLPIDSIAQELKQRHAEWADSGIESVDVIGDALAPATIAHATYAGRRYAEEFDSVPKGIDEVPFRREIVALAPTNTK